MRGLEQHREQAVVGEETLVIDRKLLGGVDRDDRRPAIQVHRIVVILHFALVRLAHGNRLRRVETREQFGGFELQLHLGAVVIVASGDCRHVARDLRRPATC